MDSRLVSSALTPYSRRTSSPSHAMQTRSMTREVREGSNDAFLTPTRPIRTYGRGRSSLPTPSLGHGREDAVTSRSSEGSSHDASNAGSLSIEAAVVPEDSASSSEPSSSPSSSNSSPTSLEHHALKPDLDNPIMRDLELHDLQTKEKQLRKVK